MPPTTTTPSSPSSISTASIAKLSTSALMEEAAESARALAALAGRIVLVAAELDRREAWRQEGATSIEAWLAERCHVSTATARAWAHVGTRLFDLPRLAEGLTSGTVSFDQVRAVVDAATPESEAALVAEAAECSVRQLGELAKTQNPAPPAPPARDHETRSVRFNDACRTMTAQLPAESYAEVRAGLEATARTLPSDGETPWDQRLADALVVTVRTAAEPQGGKRPRPARATSSAQESKTTDAEPTPSPYVVVAHVPLATLLDDDVALAGELERRGLVDAEVMRRLACDATLVIALDDDVGHTMYEGRARRVPSATQRREIWRRDRHCRFPGCANALFVNPHHLRWWRRDRGPTDLDNLALLCEHHHHLIHSKAWKVSGDANGELTFIGPSGRVMTSRPSHLWTRASAPPRGSA